MHVRLVFVSLVLSVALAAQTPIVYAAGEMMRLASSSVSAGAGGSWNITLVMDDDNSNGSLPNSWRRWWYCELRNLNPAGETLTVSVTNAGYSDTILPVWAQSSDGVTFGDFERLPTSAVPVLLPGPQHRFTVSVPPGIVSIRLAKYFPYTVTQKDAFLASIAGHPRVRSIVSLGNSLQVRPIEKIELTDSSVPDVNKERVWIHSGVHPAETTSYFVVEGLIDWLTSGDPRAELLLDRALIEVVPMANPDGVVLGNYRTNALSAEIESLWSAPYTQSIPEVVALRTGIEGYMGTVASPASNPIRVLLNLHSTHNIAFPFHFQHLSNPSWAPGCTSCGVIPLVNQIEGQWIADFAARSPLVALGTTLTSTLGLRPFVESMCHDRWTAVNGWLNAPNFEQPVMAITYEGTYGFGPDGVTWNTDDDYRQNGREMGLALFDYLGLSLSATASSYGSSCVSATLAGTLVVQPDASHIANLVVLSNAANGLALLAVGGQQVAVPLPAPWANCTLLATPDAVGAFTLNSIGSTIIQLPVPVQPGLVAFLQAFALDATLALDSSNGLRIQNNY